MCRSIVTLRRSGAPAARNEIEAARQYVRKISGYREPSRANRTVYEQAVAAVADATAALLDALVVRPRGGSGSRS
jgi:hypothetical protein